MRILFFQFPLHPAWGGAEEQILLLAKGLQKNDKEILLASSNSFLTTAFHKNGFVAINARVGWEPTSLRALFLFPITFFIAIVRLCIIFLTFRPDAIFCLSLTDKLIATVLATLFNTRVIWVEHTRIGHWFTANPLRFWYRVMSRTVKIVAPSYFLRNQLIATGIHPNRITVVYPGVSFHPLSAQADQIKRGQDGSLGLTLGFLGRLSKEKGVDFLLGTVQNLPKTRVRIAGTGPEEDALKKLAAKLEISDRCEFAGFTDNKQKFLSTIDVLVVPSTKAESFGLVITEAMAAGIPVVASRIGAIPEIIEHKKTGLLYESGNHAELLQKIKLLENDVSLRWVIINNAIKAVKARFGKEKMAGEYERLISNS